MKRKKIILLVIIILILIGGGFGYWRYQYLIQNIRKEVLNSLEGNLEFCQIVKDKVSFKKGEFWLICNSRPFYAVYEKGNLNYELNGWGFLKDQPEVLDDLQKNNCQFYATLPENILIFSCQNGEMRRYRFSSSDFKLSEIKPVENSFLNLLLESPRYYYEKPPSISESISDEGSFLEIEMKYKNHIAKFFFDLNKFYFTLPTVIDENLSTKEKADLSFEMISHCKKGNILELDSRRAILFMDCQPFGKPMINYDFESGFSNFQFPKNEFSSLFKYLFRYNFPFLKLSNLVYLKSDEDEFNEYNYYLFGERILITRSVKDSGIVSEVYFKPENLK